MFCSLIIVGKAQGEIYKEEGRLQPIFGWAAPTIIKGIIRLFIWGPRGQGARDSIRNINAPLPLPLYF
jgi:hypothetical protein